MRDEKRRGRAARAQGREGCLCEQAARQNLDPRGKWTILEAAEAVFAEHGFGGATTAAIAARAGVPKANLHYYFPTKAALYRAVIERVLTAWLAAASSFDENDDPREALARYIGAKMDLARAMPLGSRIWLSEIMRGAPVIQDFLETTLAEWVELRGANCAPLDRRGKTAPGRAEISFLYDLGDNPTFRQCRA